MTNYIVWVTVPVCVVFVSLICVQNVHRHAASNSAWSKMQMAIDKVACSQKIRKHKGHCHEKEKQWRAANATHAREYSELDKMYQDALDNIAKHEQDSAIQTMHIGNLEHKLDASHEELGDCQKASDDCQNAADDCQDKHDNCQDKHDDCQKAHDDCQKASDDCRDALSAATGAEHCYFVIQHANATSNMTYYFQHWVTPFECNRHGSTDTSNMYLCSADGAPPTNLTWSTQSGCTLSRLNAVTTPLSYSHPLETMTCWENCI